MKALNKAKELQRLTPTQLQALPHKCKKYLDSLTQLSATVRSKLEKSLEEIKDKVNSILHPLVIQVNSIPWSATAHKPAARAKKQLTIRPKDKTEREKSYLAHGIPAGAFLSMKAVPDTLVTADTFVKTIDLLLLYAPNLNPKNTDFREIYKKVQSFIKLLQKKLSETNTNLVVAQKIKQFNSTMQLLEATQRIQKKAILSVFLQPLSLVQQVRLRPVVAYSANKLLSKNFNDVLRDTKAYLARLNLILQKRPPEKLNVEESHIVLNNALKWLKVHNSELQEETNKSKLEDLLTLFDDCKRKFAAGDYAQTLDKWVDGWNFVYELLYPDASDSDSD